MNSTEPPQLAPPRAGLPFPENLIARILPGLKRGTGSPRSFTAKFVAERGRIASLVSGKDAETLSTRVLIARPPGLEESSRHWSVWMTLDHLRIVHHAFIGVLDSLANERVPDGGASTAAVKPDAQVTGAVVEEYEASCDALLALSGGHMAIHRVQIERILQVMGKSAR